MHIKLFGNLASQPTRAAAWLMTVKSLPFELVPVRPPNLGVTPEFIKMNPNGLVPVLQEGDFSIFEGNAILVYLAERNGWKELYPEDPQQRAKIHQYLHWHHSNARLATTQVIRPLAMQMWGMATPEMLTKTEPERMEKTLTSIVEFVETFLAMPFIALTRQPTIADFACYCELDQIEAMDLFDFSKYPKTADWMQRMKEIPHHDEIRADLRRFVAKMRPTA